MQFWFLIRGVGMGMGGEGPAPEPAVITSDLTLEIFPYVELTLEIDPTVSGTFDL